MSKRMRVLLLSMVTLLLGVALVVGGTFALFSDQATVNNHLAAGELKVGLFRTSYTQYVLGTDGRMTETTDATTRVDLRTDNAKLFVAEKAVPTSYYSATIEVSNLGNVAFDYGARVVWTDDTENDEDQIIAEQIRITVTVGTTQKAQFTLAECTGNDVALGSILAGHAAQSFVVKAEFLNDESNNEAMTATVDFDLQVYATQKTA